MCIRSSVMILIMRWKISVHEVEDKEFWNQEFQKDKTQQEYMERYYEELLYLVQHYHHYSVLGHMDLIKRYDKAGSYPFLPLEAIAISRNIWEPSWKKPGWN